MYKTTLVVFLLLGTEIFIQSELLHYDGKIIGGTPANITNYPYQLSFEVEGKHQCGASVISKLWAVTAAHCVLRVPTRSVKLRAGSSYRGKGGELYSVSRIVRHPNFNMLTVDYDVAVLKQCGCRFSRPIDLGASVQPISLAASEPAAGTPATVTGWGLTSEGNYTSLASQLHQVQVPITEFNQCRQAYSKLDAITPRMICAASPGGGKDACQNDSGGPLAANGQLVGIVSWGRGCGNGDYPGVYTNVADLHSWISDVTGVQ